MSVVLVVEESIKLKFLEWSKEIISIGPIIGQNVSRCYYIVHAVKTQIPNFTGPMRVLPEEIISDHSFIINQMLPGGFYIMGLFVITSEELWNTEWNFNKIKSIMKNVNLRLKEEKIFRGTSGDSNLFLLQVDPEAQKSQSWTFHYDEILEEVEPVKIQYRSLKNCFYVGQYSRNYISPYKELDWNELENGFDKYWKSIERFEQDVAKSTFLLNGKKINEVKSKIRDNLMKNESSDSASEVEDEFTLNHFRPKGEKDFTLFVCVFKPIYNYSWNCIQEESNEEKVFVHENMTISEVLQAVKDDIVRSWASRLQFHIDLLKESDGKRKGSMKKISILFESSKIPFYLYLFENEPLCSKKLQGLLNKILFLRRQDKFILLDKDSDLGDNRNREWRSQEENSGLGYLHFLFLSFVLLLMCVIFHLMFTKKYNGVWK